MVNLKPNQWTSNTGELMTSYKIGMLGPSGYGIMQTECIIGQFLKHPYVNRATPNGKGGTWNSINAQIFLMNNTEPTNIVPDAQGTIRISIPERILPIIDAQDWTGRFFKIYLKSFGNQGKHTWDMLECDAQGNVLEQQPFVDRSQPSPQVPAMGQNRPAQQMAPGMNQMNQQVNPAYNQQPMAQPQYQQQPQQVAQPVPAYNAPVQPAPVQTPNVPVQPQVAPQPIAQPPVAPQPVMQQPAPVQQGSVLPPLPPTAPAVPQPDQVEAPKPVAKGHANYGLTDTDNELIQHLLCTPKYAAWKDGANTSQETFGQALGVVANQEGIIAMTEDKIVKAYEFYKTQ